MASDRNSTKTPTIIVFCGSTRFMDAFHEANRKETLEGKIVLLVELDSYHQAARGEAIKSRPRISI